MSLQENNKRETKMTFMPSNKSFNVFLILLLLIACGNDDDVEQDKIYTGKLVIQGVCMHYVIQVNDTDFPQELIEKNWTDEASGIEYENVFALRGNGDTSESVCDFPENIKEGDSFQFMIGNKKRIKLTSFLNDCAVCDAYSQAPKKYLSITVIKN